MPVVVMSTDIQEVKVQAFGNWFAFKPGQIKPMEDNIGRFLTTEKAEQGFVSLPESVLDDPTSEESIAAKAEATRRGRERIMDRLEKQKYNLEVSLQKDLDIAGMKVNSSLLASKGDVAALKHLNALQTEMRKEQSINAEEVQKLLEMTNGDAHSAEPKQTYKRG